MHSSRHRTKLAWPGWICGYIGLLFLTAGTGLAAPTVVSVQPPPDGLYGDSFLRREHYTSITLTFSEPIVVTGSPTLRIRIGSTDRESGVPIHVGPTTVLFSLSPGAGENGALTITGPIVLHDATIKGTDGSPASLSFTPVSVPGVIFDMVPPAAPVVRDVTPASPTSEEKFTIRGTAEPGASVAYGLDQGMYGNAPVDANGNWSVTLGPVAAGPHSFGTTARDAAGNFTSFPALFVSGINFTVQAAVSPAPAPGRLINVSSRLQVTGDGTDHTLITGFVIAGAASQRVLLRGVGPALATFGVQAPLANPRVRLFNASGLVVQENDDWTGIDVAATATAVGAFSLVTGSRDAALVQSLPPGAYSLHVLGNGGSGIALAEIFDASTSGDTPRPALINLSTRGFVGTGESQLGAGFVIGGATPLRVLVRGAGPALAAYGVGDALADPQITLYQATAVIARNDNWETPAPPGGEPSGASPAEIAAAAAATGAFALRTGSKDAALLLTLAPGAYTAFVSGAGGSTGTALVEIYVVR